jgi:hypothetical protein
MGLVKLIIAILQRCLEDADVRNEPITEVIDEPSVLLTPEQVGAEPTNNLNIPPLNLTPITGTVVPPLSARTVYQPIKKYFN